MIRKTPHPHRDYSKNYNYFDRVADNEPQDLNLYTKPNLSRAHEITGFMNFAGLLNSQYNILEIGAGRGNYTIPLLQQGHRVSVVDISKKSLDLLEKKADFLNLKTNLGDIYHGDVFAIPSEKKYDIVIGTDVLHHVVDDIEKLDRCFKKIKAFLKNQGRIVFKEPNPLFPWRLYFFLSPTMSWTDECGIRFLTKKNLKASLTKNNFKKIKFKNTDLLPFTNKSKILFKLEKLINKSPIIKFISWKHLISAEN